MRIGWSRGRRAAAMRGRWWSAFLPRTSRTAAIPAIAGEAGGDAAAARAMLDSDEGEAAVRASERRALEIGIGGVPFFVFNGRVAVSGAQEPQTLASAIAEAVRTPGPTAAKA
jgi:predicted DsbA family dithiol-disulfide isomerase